MKFSYTKNPESEFFIKNPNLTKKKKFWRLGGEGVWIGCFLFFFFFQKNTSEEKKFFLRK